MMPIKSLCRYLQAFFAATIRCSHMASFAEIQQWQTSLSTKPIALSPGNRVIFDSSLVLHHLSCSRRTFLWDVVSTFNCSIFTSAMFHTSHFLTRLTQVEPIIILPLLSHCSSLQLLSITTLDSREWVIFQSQPRPSQEKTPQNSVVHYATTGLAITAKLAKWASIWMDTDHCRSSDLNAPR